MTKDAVLATIKTVSQYLADLVPAPYREASLDAVNGVLCIASGEYMLAAKSLVMAAEALVPPTPDDVKSYLTVEGAERQQLRADVEEVIKFEALS